MAPASRQTDSHIYLVAAKVNACQPKELSHLGLAFLKVERWSSRDGEPTGLDCVVHCPTSGCFLKVGLCIFKRKTRRNKPVMVSVILSLSEVWFNREEKIAIVAYSLCFLGFAWKCFLWVSIVFHSLGHLWRINHSSTTDNKWWHLT